jgi:hypothetical protein
MDGLLGGTATGGTGCAAATMSATEGVATPAEAATGGIGWAVAGTADLK